MYNNMKKLFLLGTMVCAFGMMAACKSGTTDNKDFEEAEVIKSASFGPEDTPESIDTALKAAGLPMHIEWDSDGTATLVTDGMAFYVTDSIGIEYICQVEEIIFNDEPWLCITYTEDLTGQYWQIMGPKRGGSLFYETELISPQAEPYQMASHGVTIHDSDGDCDAIVVRYLESGTLDTIRYTQVID